ncbi:MAG: glycosyltransferase family 4 protein, partial [Kofleriaceae bacterium]
VECRVIGWLDGVGPTELPRRNQFAALGIRGVRRTTDRLRYDLGHPVELVRDFFGAVHDAIRTFRPTVVCAQLERALLAVEIARAHGIGAVWSVHDAEPGLHAPDQLALATRAGAELVTCSPFLRRLLAERHRLRSTVVYPCVDLDAYRVERARDGFITMINPIARKGFETFLALAQRLPDLRFLVVEGWPFGEEFRATVRRRLEPLPNVRFEPAHADMRRVYRRTRLLLAPSRWEEAFGRVVLEAQASGIPAIVSRRGGLAEIGGGTVVIDRYRSTEAWVAAIRAVTGDPATLARLSAAATRNAARSTYQLAVNAERFLAVADRAAGRRSPARSGSRGDAGGRRAAARDPCGSRPRGRGARGATATRGCDRDRARQRASPRRLRSARRRRRVDSPDCCSWRTKSNCAGFCVNHADNSTPDGNGCSPVVTRRAGRRAAGSAARRARARTCR